MRKTASFVLICALLLALCGGCAGERGGGGTTPYSPAGLAAGLLASQREGPEFYYVTEEDSVFAAYAALYLGQAGGVARGAICYPVGAYASEVAVFEMTSEEEARRAPEAMADYLRTRAAAFCGYAPEEAKLAENGQIRVLGRFVVLWILGDGDAADQALAAAFSADPPEEKELGEYALPLRALEEPEDPAEDAGRTGEGPEAPTGGPEDPSTEVPDEYDHDAVLAALREGDPAGLSPKNGAVYDAVRGILEEIISPGMSDCDKELAVNDYLVFHADYDPAELSSGPVGTPDPDNANPYGLLVHGVGICLGYASTFQLMMDALGIECLTVRGYAYGWEEDHAWNLVRLDGDWYAVDVTWNDPVFDGGTPSDALRRYYAHCYFNVTSGYLRRTDHQWDQDVPEAEGTKWGKNWL